MKPFQLGIIVGRFQTFHTGHAYMIEKAIALCEEIGIFVGSSQESGTLKNPYSYETRERILQTVFPDAIRIFPLPDIGVGNNSKWGDYVLSNVVERFGRTPDLLVSGKEERRLDWFDSVAGLRIAELYVPKIINVSATRMRECLICGDLAEWKRFTPEILWPDYETLRADVLAAQDNRFTESL